MLMKTTNRRKLNRLIRECYGEIEPVSMALLTIEEIIDLIMITVAALQGDAIVDEIPESKKEKYRRRLYESNRRIRSIRRHS